MIYTNDIIKQRKIKRHSKIRNFFRFIVLLSIMIMLVFLVDKNFSIYIEQKEISIFGYKQYVMKSGNMKPTYKVGDILITKEVEKEDIKENDVISFREKEGNNIVTHRVVSIVEQEGNTYYQTKADKNESVDNDLVSFEQIQGKVVYNLDNGKTVVSKLTTIIGFFIILLIILLCYLYTCKKEERIIIREEAREK